MAGLETLGQRLIAASADVKRDAALKAAQAAGNAFLHELQRVTPVRHGTLRRSERVNSVTGGGTKATAAIGPHTVYARFRNYGGTIHVKRASVLSDGHSFFGKQVTQAGSHYMEKAAGWAAAGGLDGPVSHAIDEVLRGSGL